MSIFDSIKRSIGNSVKKEAAKAVNNAVSNIGKGRNHTESFTFSALPTSVAELQAIPECSLDTAFKTAALTIAVLCHYEKDTDATFAMLDFLKGPENVSPFEKQFIGERLRDKGYKMYAFFKGATPQNNYTPTTPYTIEIIENPYSFDNENWATLWVKSGGADNPSSIKLRKKPSTGQWFLNDIQCLSDIRLPVAKDDWA